MCILLASPHRALLEAAVEQIVGKLRRLAEGQDVSGVVLRDRAYRFGPSGDFSRSAKKSSSARTAGIMPRLDG